MDDPYSSQNEFKVTDNRHWMNHTSTSETDAYASVKLDLTLGKAQYTDFLLLTVIVITILKVMTLSQDRCWPVTGTTMTPNNAI